MPYIGQAPTTAAFLTDTFSGDGTTTAFTMSVAPATPSSVLVAVSGVLQDPSTYSVSGTNLTFSGAPPSGTGNISARYLGIPASGVTTTAYRTITEFTATAGQTTFTPPSYTVGFINVYRNGVLLGSADYTATNGTTVVLTTGATAGDLVTVESFLVSSVLNAIPNTAGAVNSSAIATGAVTTVKIADANVTQAKLGTNVAGTGPAFSAYQNSATALANNTYTKLLFQVEEFDTNNCYNNTGSTATLNGLSVPAYAFMPNIAGYYQLTASISFAGTPSTETVLAIYKNGSVWKFLQDMKMTTLYSFSASVLVYANGTTDYFDIYAYQSTGVIMNTTASQNSTFFQGVMVRAA